MRIALDATYSVDPYPSGIAIYSGELISGLPKRYQEHEFVFCYRLKQWTRAIKPKASNVRMRPLLPPLPTFRANIFHALNQRVDHRPAKIVISTFHDLFVLTGEYSSPDFRTRFATQARQAAANSDFIIAVSEFTATQIVELLNFNRSRIRVVPHGVHSPSGAASTGRTREKIVLFVGALQTRKNVRRLVQAFRCLPQDWRLVLAGAPSGYGADRILDEISADSTGRIEVTGYVSKDKLLELYSRASIFAFPSLDEGFGIPLLEAMAHGVPVITSNRSALSEVADNAALLIDPEETEQLCEALKTLAVDESLRTTLASLGRHRAQAFSWEKTLTKTFEVYKEAAKDYF